MPRNIKIKENYIPKAKRQAASNSNNGKPIVGVPVKNSSAVLKTVCPQCKQQIPINEIQQHIKVELLDPRWKVQKERELEKKRESNLISGTHVVKALERLAEVRPDIFGGDELEAEKKLRDQRVKAAERETSAWDGHATSINLATGKAFKRKMDEAELEEAARMELGTAVTVAPRPAQPSSYNP